MARTGSDEPLARAARSRPGVVPDDHDAVALRAADPLAGRLRDRLERDRLVDAGSERQGDPVARRLDLLDRVEPGGLDRRPVAAVRGRDLGVGRDDVDPVGRQRVGERDQASRRAASGAAPMATGPRGR